MVIHYTYLLGACFFASPPFSGAKPVIHQQAICCQHVVMFHCFFSILQSCETFGCCSLAQNMSFVTHYQPYFKQWFIIHLLWAFLPFQPFVYS
jgi:hypothetical protein